MATAETALTPEQKNQLITKEWQASLLTPLLKPSEERRSVPKEPLIVSNNKKLASMKVSGMPMSLVLGAIADLSGLHLVMGPEVTDKQVTLDVTSMPVDQVISLVLYPIGYGYKIEDGQLVVLAQQTQVFRILLPPVVEDFNDVTSNESFVQSGDSSQSHVNNNQQVKVGTKVVVGSRSSGISFWDDVLANVTSIASSTAKISLNKPAGMVLVTDAPNNLESIRRYFEELNSRISAQLEVDVKVVEVTLHDENRFGVDWNVLAGDLKALNSIGFASNFTANNFTNGNFLKFNMDGSKEGSGITQNGFKLAIDALSKQGNVEVVSQPRVRILNNQVAVIQVGSTQSYVDRSTFETTQTGTVTSVSTSQVQEGVTMRLLANIVGDDIYLSVTPVVTNIDQIRSIVSGNTTIEAPQTTTKSINTMVRLTQGQTVAIGGLITTTKDHGKQGVPIVNKIPILGKLFEYSVNKDSKQELIIFITPRKG